MPSYVVLARKWRPAQFADIVGQNHIVRTLTNAIETQRIHHAYLFTGGRGIGKTSMARIFAKNLRCQFLKPASNSPSNTTPLNIADACIRSCDECSDCKEIAAGNSVDVIEIDGASNNGVEAVREIRDSARYMPSSGVRKIYIIDEVHMLTTAAFNALLKTLEEPPAHVLFIFATTEPHKIPATILSRCQRFDYKRVNLAQIQSRLNYVIEAEKIQADPAAVALLARAAEGSLRDALSLLDQAIAFSGNEITLQSLRECIGLIEGQTLIGIWEAVFLKKPLDAVRLVEQAYQQGHDLRVLTRNLVEFLHAVLLAKIGSENAGGIDVSPEEWQALKNISAFRSLEEMELFFQVLHQGVEWIARSSQPKVILNVLLIKCATADALFALESSAVTQTKNKETAAVENPVLAKPEPAALPASAAPAPQVVANPQVSLQPDSRSNPGPISAPQEKNWEQFIQHVRKTRPLLASILEHASCSDLPTGNLNNHTLGIHFSPGEAYFREQLLSRAYQEQLGQLSKEFFGNQIRLKIELKEAGESMAAKKEREYRERLETIRNKAEKHPILLEAKSLFGGDLGPIEVREAKNAELST